MIGVSFGAPTEFRSNGKINEAELPEWKPERVSNALDQDDLYVDMTFAEVLDDKGIDATTEDFGAMFKDAKYQLWHANLAARRASAAAFPPRSPARRKYNAHANDIDFQIEADFIGLMTPGLPQSANTICLARRPRHELRRRHLRRHVRVRHVRRGLLRIRPAQGGRGRPGLDPRQEPLRAGHSRRAGMVTSSIPRTGKRPGS